MSAVIFREPQSASNFKRLADYYARLACVMSSARVVEVPALPCPSANWLRARDYEMQEMLDGRYPTNDTYGD